jgi:hypothetical protein
LEHHPDATLMGGQVGLGGDVVEDGAVEVDVAVEGAVQPGDQPQQPGLARTRRTEQHGQAGWQGEAGVEVELADAGAGVDFEAHRAVLSSRRTASRIAIAKAESTPASTPAVE